MYEEEEDNTKSNTLFNESVGLPYTVDLLTGNSNTNSNTNSNSNKIMEIFKKRATITTCLGITGTILVCVCIMLIDNHVKHNDKIYYYAIILLIIALILCCCCLKYKCSRQHIQLLP